MSARRFRPHSLARFAALRTTGLVLLTSAIFLLSPGPSSAAPSIFSVNGTWDQQDFNPGEGICDAQSMMPGLQCGLRAAIQEANAHSGLDAIHFNIGGAAPYTFAPATAYPTITSQVTIDATTEPDYAGTPVVVLNRGTAAAQADGLVLSGGSITVRGLVINGFGGSGIRITGSGHNVIESSYIGTNVSGTAAVANAYGIAVYGAPDNVVGGTSPGARNVISGNTFAGVHIAGVTATGNVVQGNYIGTNASGTGPLPNEEGIRIDAAPTNTIGGSSGTTPGGACTGACNLVSGNSNAGVYIINSAAGNVVAGNFIGTDSGGGAAVPNSSGVYIDASNDNTVGGPGAGALNVISGNSFDGVIVSGGSTGNGILNNYIGVSSNGTADLGNNFNGVVIASSSGNTIGSPSGTRRNVISGNGIVGVLINGGSTGNFVLNSYIGTNADGTAAMPNGGQGVMVDDSPGNTIGTTVPAARNVISGNNLSGVELSSLGATGNVVLGNYIGLDASGSTALPNLEEGVIIGSPANTIGGTSSTARNVISGNAYRGVQIIGVSATGNFVQGNYIGTNAAGDAAIGNETGLRIQGSTGNTIGGTTPGARNVISGNQWSGLSIAGPGATANVVQGNYIGTNAAGTGPVSNKDDGFVVTGPNNIIGGTGAARNVISGNREDGLVISGADATGNTVQGNHIGTNATGDTPLPNGESGVAVYSPNNTIGGSGGLGNIISGNHMNGVRLREGASGNTVRGNYIGIGAANQPLGNGGHGVYAWNSGPNTIGGTDSGLANTIAYNGGDGVAIVLAIGGSHNKAVLRKAIHDNNELGIDLDDDGVTGNDTGDGDDGANGWQNFPVITDAESDGASTFVGWTLNSTPNTSFRVEFFTSPQCDSPSGHGEGQGFIAWIPADTDGSGNTSGNTSFGGVAIPGGWYLTATATDPVDNTSEFSQCAEVVGPPEPTPTPTPSPTPTVTATPTATGPTPTPTLTPTPTTPGTPGPTGTPYEGVFGNVDCDKDVDAVDALKVLRHVAGLPVSQDDPCPEIGSEVASKFGDVDCDGEVDAVDALRILRYVALLPNNLPSGCGPIGT